MHVLHLTNDFQQNGTGITNMLRTLALAQRRRGWEVSIGSEVAGSSYIDELRSLGVQFHQFDHIASPSDAWRVARQIRGIEGVDIVHAHTARAALAACLAGSRVRRRSVATIHNVFQRSSALMSGCAAVVCISQDARSRFQRMAPWSARRQHVVYNAVDVETSGPRADLPERSIVYVGGLHPRKGVDVLVEAVAQLVDDGDEVELFVYGNRDNPGLEARAAELGASHRVHFMGFVADPRPAMRAARVFAIPSRDEPFGLVAVEARACSAAIVASDVGGLPEALDHGAAGVLVPAGDIGRWATELQRMLDDDARRARFSRAAADGLSRFAPDTMESGYAAIYDTVRSLATTRWRRSAPARNG